MGQAVVDLPDPLDSPNIAGGVSADDLLSKLAGDEIDRLLAESDNGDTEPKPPSVAVAPVLPAAVPVVVETPPSVPVAAPAVPETPVAPPAQAPTANLGEVLNTADAERPALLDPPAAPVLQSMPIDLGKTPEPRNIRAMLLKPLMWINAPLDPWPDQVREAIGKIGLVTLINALAVIAYVLLFRKHHH